jgi:putative ABC transport system ATP-binding protein
MSAPLYTIRGLEKTYFSGDVPTHALNGIDLDLFAGELIVLLGPSGSGKSSLLNAIGCLDKPTRGTIHFRDLSLTELDEAARTSYRRTHVGFVFQSYNLISSLTAGENVALGSIKVDGALPSSEALELVGLKDRFERFPAHLSGGEQQRVAVARAIAKQPEVLLCDEPTGALDCASGVRVLEAIERVRRDFGTLALLVTHNAVIASMADRVFTLAHGKITAVGANAHPRRAGDLSW